MKNTPVAIVMGSDSDLSVMKDAVSTLIELGINYHIEVVSAHRTPQRMLEFAEEAVGKGFKVIIAGAGGAAHLPGMIASATTLPVIGVPVKLRRLRGLDSLLSIVQMPKGVPVATVAIDNATNAALLAARILACSDKKLQSLLVKQQKQMKTKVKMANKNLKSKLDDLLKD
jgi:5-(carboxyamino)imidazole ribonucleotide mutase